MMISSEEKRTEIKISLTDPTTEQETEIFLRGVPQWNDVRKEYDPDHVLDQKYQENIITEEEVWITQILRSYSELDSFSWMELTEKPQD